MQKLYEKKKSEGDEEIFYEYGMKYCTYQKQFVFFNWNCPNHQTW